MKLSVITAMMLLGVNGTANAGYIFHFRATSYNLDSVGDADDALALFGSIPLTYDAVITLPTTYLSSDSAFVVGEVSSLSVDGVEWALGSFNVAYFWLGPDSIGGTFGAARTDGAYMSWAIGAEYSSVSNDPRNFLVNLGDLIKVSYGATLNADMHASGISFDGGTISIFHFQGVSTPEPTSWVMMVGGFGLTGGAMRNRKQTIRFV